ncbi:MAG: hypothetical protein GF315_03610 [candidate division Zixibacteria bacterium]|nr:hypothetical protein [candidate division Zixibacteria bacterium]
MSSKLREFKIWLPPLLVLLSVILIVHALVSSNRGMSQINNQIVTVREDIDSTKRHFDYIAEAPQEIVAIINKHILADSQPEKQTYLEEITIIQNNLLDSIYSIEEKLDGSRWGYIDSIKSVVAVFITNHLKAQDFSFNNLRSKAWEVSLSQLEPQSKSISGYVDKLRQSLDNFAETNIADFNEEKERTIFARNVELIIAFVLIAVAAGLFFTSNRTKSKRLPKKGKLPPSKPVSTPPKAASNPKPEGKKERPPSYAQSETQKRRHDRSESSFQGANENSKKQTEAQPSSDESHNTPDDINDISKTVSKISAASAKNTSDVASQFVQTYQNASKISGLMKSASDISYSSIAEAQELAVKAAKVGENEIRKLVYFTLRLAEETREIMKENDNSITSSIKDVEKTRQELKGIINNVDQVSNLLSQVGGFSNTVDNSLEEELKRFASSSGINEPIKREPAHQTEQPQQQDDARSEEQAKQRPDSPQQQSAHQTTESDGAEPDADENKNFMDGEFDDIIGNVEGKESDEESSGDEEKSPSETKATARSQNKSSAEKPEELEDLLSQQDSDSSDPKPEANTDDSEESSGVKETEITDEKMEEALSKEDLDYLTEMENLDDENEDNSEQLNEGISKEADEELLRESSK